MSVGIDRHGPRPDPLVQDQSLIPWLRERWLGVGNLQKVLPKRAVRR